MKNSNHLFLFICMAVLATAVIISGCGHDHIAEAKDQGDQEYDQENQGEHDQGEQDDDTNCSEEEEPTADKFSNRAVYGGITDATGTYDAVVLLRTSLGWCTGTLISPNRILTAAHCVCDAVDPGERPWTITAKDCKGWSYVYFYKGATTWRLFASESAVVVHPGYVLELHKDSSVFDITHDLAIIKFDFGIVDIAPIPIADKLEASFNATVVGFGHSQCGFGVLRYGQITVTKVTEDTVQTHQLTDKPVKVWAGNGDSGGPLLVRNNDGLETVVGITSSGNGSFGDGLFTNAVEYSKWILAQ